MIQPLVRTGVDVVGIQVSIDVVSIHVVDQHSMTRYSHIKTGLLTVFAKKILVGCGGVVSNYIGIDLGVAQQNRLLVGKQGWVGPGEIVFCPGIVVSRFGSVGAVPGPFAHQIPFAGSGILATGSVVHIVKIGSTQVVTKLVAHHPDG